MSYLRPTVASCFVLAVASDQVSSDSTLSHPVRPSSVLGAILAADAIITLTTWLLKRRTEKKLTEKEAFQPTTDISASQPSSSTVSEPSVSISDQTPSVVSSDAPIPPPISSSPTVSSFAPPPPSFDAPAAPAFESAPMAPSFDAPAAPAFEAAPMAPSFDMPPPPPPFGAPPAPSFGAPPAPSFDAPPMAPAAPGAPMISAPARATGPTKPNVKPPVPMKAFRWSVIAPNAISASIWKDVNDDRIKLDVDDLMEKFKAKPTAVIDKPAVPARKMKVQLIDSKRSDHVSIALKRFGMPAEAIRAALLSMDGKALDSEKVENLKKIIPTDDELKAVQDFEGDLDEVGAAEKFFLIIGEIPLLQLRTELFSSMLTFDAQLQDATHQIEVCSAAASAIRKSQQLQTIFATILKLGNFVNGGTNRAGAFGFQLSTINKLKDVQSSEPGYSLLHYLVEQCADQADFIQQLVGLNEASRIELAVLKSQVNQLNAAVNKAKNASTKPGDANDQLAPVMKLFAARAEPRSKGLTEQMSKLEDDISQTMKYYCEDLATMKAEQFFSVFLTFRDDFKAAVQKIDLKKAAAEKALKVLEEPIRRARTPSGSPVL